MIKEMRMRSFLFIGAVCLLTACAEKAPTERPPESIVEKDEVDGPAKFSAGIEPELQKIVSDNSAVVNAAVVSENTLGDLKESTSEDTAGMSAADSITASKFAIEMNAGWNLGNSLDAHYGSPTGDANLSQETIWGNPPVSHELIDYVAQQGFDVIRVPVSWYYHSYSDEDGNVRISKGWLDRVKEVVDYAYDDGLYVIIDSHHDQPIIYAGVSDSDMEKVYADARSMWSDIASYFADYDDHLIFESFNEVDNLAKSWSFGEKAAAQMNELNQVFVDTVRSCGGENAERILMVPTLLDSYKEEAVNAFRLPKDKVSDRLLVTVHCYSTIFDQDIDDFFANMEKFSDAAGAPVIVGEWGTTFHYSPENYRSIHAGNYIARAKEHGIKCIVWDNGSDYDYVNRKDPSSSNKELIDAIMNPKEFVMGGKVSLDDMSSFTYETIDQKTGLPKSDESWGTIITSEGNNAYPVESGHDSMMLVLKASGDAENLKIHYVYFFDESGKLLDFVNDAGGFDCNTVAIPKGAVRVRIGINSSTNATSAGDYERYFKKDQLELIIGYM